MRGADEQTGALFSYLSPEALVPKNHPLWAIRQLVNAALEQLSPKFDAVYASGGHPSIAPEKLLRALLLQAIYGVRSERQVMEQITHIMLFRWFIGLSMDAPVWDVTVFTKNRERLLAGDVAVPFLLAVIADPAVKRLLSTERVSVDGTLMDAWTSMTSFRRKDGSDNPPPGAGRSWYSPTGAHFNIQGHDEMTEVSGDGDADLEPDGTLTGEIRFHHGDDMPFTAKRW